MAETKARRLRNLLRDARPLVSPGVYDGYSVRLVQAMGFKTAATTGAGLTNSVIVQPDVGIFGLRDNVDACRHLARSVDIPLTATPAITRAVIPTYIPIEGNVPDRRCRLQ